MCEFCGQPGCHWRRHPEAVADALAYDRERQAEEFPFGDHVEH